MSVWPRIDAAIRAHGAAALVSIVRLEGSGPREAGARMVVLPGGGFFGTIGGGTLEHQALADAGRMLAEGGPAGVIRVQSLGPDLGQCCGGRTQLSIEVFTTPDLGWIAPLAADENAGPIRTVGTQDAHGRRVRHLAVGPADGVEVFGEMVTPLLLFGAGHVGRALVLALAPLPFDVRWIDQRAEQFPAHVPGNVTIDHRADPIAALEAAPAGTFVAVMTHSHPLDLALVAAALAQARFPYVGLIGSQTKRARFVSQLRQAGVSDAALAKLHCPIGGRRLQDKAPAVIAAAIAVELLEVRERIAQH